MNADTGNRISDYDFFWGGGEKEPSWSGSFFVNMIHYLFIYLADAFIQRNVRGMSLYVGLQGEAQQSSGKVPRTPKLGVSTIHSYS